MVLVPLPCNGNVTQCYTWDINAVATALQSSPYNIVVPIITIPTLSNGQYLGVRISCQIYNEITDYEALADAFVNLGVSKY